MASPRSTPSINGEITLEETPGTTPNTTPPNGSSPNPTPPNTPINARLDDPVRVEVEKKPETPRPIEPESANSILNDSVTINDDEIKHGNISEASETESEENSVIQTFIPHPEANRQIDLPDAPEEESDADDELLKKGCVLAATKIVTLKTLRFMQETLPAAGAYTIFFVNGKTCPTRGFDGQDGLTAGLTIMAAHIVDRFLQNLAFETQPTAEPRMRGQGRLSLGMSIESMIAIAKLAVAGAIGLGLDFGAKAIDEESLHGPNAAIVIGVTSYCGAKIVGKALNWILSPSRFRYEEIEECLARSPAQHAGGYAVVGLQTACAVMLVNYAIAHDDTFSPSGNHEAINTMTRVVLNAIAFDGLERSNRLFHHQDCRRLQKPHKTHDEELGSASDVDYSDEEVSEDTALQGPKPSSTTRAQKLVGLAKDVGPAVVTLLLTSGVGFSIEQGADQWNEPDYETAGTWTAANAAMTIATYLLFDPQAAKQFASNLAGNTAAVGKGTASLVSSGWDFFSSQAKNLLSNRPTRDPEAQTPRNAFGIRKT